MRTMRRVLALSIVLIVLAACGSAGTGALPGGDQRSTVGNSVGNGQGGPPPAAGGPDDASAGDGFADPYQIGARDDAKIIRTGSLQIEVSDVPAALRAARDAIVAMGGYVGASNTSNVDERPFAEISYRIPAHRWEEALDALRILNGLTTKVVNEQTQAVEVTGQIIDLEARIRNLRASETALQTIAANATKVSDVLEVEERLTAVRGQIEQLTAQLVDLNDRAAFTTLTVSFSQAVVAAELASKEWEPAMTVDEATASLISIIQGIANAGIWFLIVWVPVLLILGLVGAFIVWLARRAGLTRRRGGDSGFPPPTTPLQGSAGAADGWR